MIRQLLQWLIGDLHDPAWKPTGVRRVFDGHDEAKAVQATERAEKEARARRKLAVKRVQPRVIQQPNVREFRKVK